MNTKSFFALLATAALLVPASVSAQTTTVSPPTTNRAAGGMDPELQTLVQSIQTKLKAGKNTESMQIGKRRVGKECASMCRSRWSPYH